MKSPTFDRDGYPTDETLDALRAWGDADANAALDFIAAAWNTQDGDCRHALYDAEEHVIHTEYGERFLRLVTGGSEGHEDLIRAFRESLVWDLTWRLSTAGGLHIFRYV